MRTHELEEYGHAADPGRRAQGGGLVGGTTGVATRRPRAGPRAGSRGAHGNDDSERATQPARADDFAEVVDGGSSLLHLA